MAFDHRAKEEVGLTETLPIATGGPRSSQQAVEVGLRLARERGARVAFVHSPPGVAATLFERNPYTLALAEELVHSDESRRLSAAAGW